MHPAGCSQMVRNELSKPTLTDGSDTAMNMGSGRNRPKKKLPPGLMKKLERGGELSPGWQKKVARGEVLAWIIHEYRCRFSPESAFWLFAA